MGLESQFEKVVSKATTREDLLELESNPFATEVEKPSQFEKVISLESEWITEEL